MRFYAQGAYQLGVAQDGAVNLSQSLVSRAIRQVTDALIEVFGSIISFPTTRELRERVERR